MFCLKNNLTSFQIQFGSNAWSCLILGWRTLWLRWLYSGLSSSSFLSASQRRRKIHTHTRTHTKFQQAFTWERGGAVPCGWVFVWPETGACAPFVRDRSWGFDLTKIHFILPFGANSVSSRHLHAVRHKSLLFLLAGKCAGNAFCDFFPPEPSAARTPAVAHLIW